MREGGLPAVFARAALSNQRFKAVTHRTPQVRPTWDAHNSVLGERPWLTAYRSKDVSPDEHRSKPGLMLAARSRC